MQNLLLVVKQRMSNLKLITGVTEQEFFNKEEAGTLTAGMYLFKDTQNTAIVETDGTVSLKTQSVREGTYNNLGSGLILVKEGDQKGYSLYYRRGSVDYAISGGSGTGGGTSSDSQIFYTNLTTNLPAGYTIIEPTPTEIGINYITMDIFDSEGMELFIQLQKYNRGFRVYSEVEVPNAQIRIIESRS